MKKLLLLSLLVLFGCQNNSNINNDKIESLENEIIQLQKELDSVINEIRQLDEMTKRIYDDILYLHSDF